MPAAASTVLAGTKEELVRLQSDIGMLQDQMREFEKTITENYSGLKSLMEQLNDQVAESTMILKRIADDLERQETDSRSDKNEIIPEIKNLSGKLDDALTSISALARQVSELQVQSTPPDRFIPSDLSSADTIFDQAFRHLIEGSWEMAIQGFNTYLNLFPSGDRATAAHYNIGEAYYNMERYSQAMEVFTRIIDENADSDKVASALYKRGKSALKIRDYDTAEADFKNLMEKYPEAPETGLAKVELQDLDISGNIR
jgi:tol-pal system protein YbgF